MNLPNNCGARASGRNDGVLHGGFYYSPESPKAKFTRLGNKRLTEYCEPKKMPMNRCGKLVTAQDCSEHPALDELLKREKINDIYLQAITEEEAKSIELRVNTIYLCLLQEYQWSIQLKFCRERPAMPVMKGYEFVAGFSISSKRSWVFLG